MIEWIEKWWQFLVSGPIWWLIYWFFTKWLPSHPGHVQKWLYYFWRLIPFTLSYKRRQIIEKEIHGFISEEINSINKEAFGFPILPKGIKVEWTLKKSKETTIEENDIIIRFGSRVEACENFVDALVLYLEKGFMPNAQAYLDPILLDACKFQTAISMLKKRKDEYYRVFLTKYYKPSIENHSKILNYSEKLESLERNGIFACCFLPTISFYTDRWIFQRRAPSKSIHTDIIGLLDFIHNIVIKEKYEEETGEEPPLHYCGAFLNVAIILVARPIYAEQFDYKPHLKKAIERLQKGTDILFIIGTGKNNMALAEMAAMRLKKESCAECIDDKSKFKFHGRHDKLIDGICFAFCRHS